MSKEIKFKQFGCTGIVSYMDNFKYSSLHHSGSVDLSKLDYRKPVKKSFIREVFSGGSSISNIDLLFGLTSASSQSAWMGD